MVFVEVAFHLLERVRSGSRVVISHASGEVGLDAGHVYALCATGQFGAGLGEGDPNRSPILGIRVASQQLASFDSSRDAMVATLGNSGALERSVELANGLTFPGADVGLLAARNAFQFAWDLAVARSHGCDRARRIPRPRRVTDLPRAQLRAVARVPIGDATGQVGPCAAARATSVVGGGKAEVARHLAGADSAVASSSTAAPRGSAETSTVVRAGRGSANRRVNASLSRSIEAMSVR